MAHAGGFTRQFERQPRISRGNHRPGVYKDLSADLFGNSFSVQRDRAASRCGYPLLKTQKRSVLGRVAEPTPPQNRSILDDVIQPGLPDLSCSEIRGISKIRESPDEGESPGDIVICDHQRFAKTFIYVIPDRTEFIHDSLIGPALERATEIDANDLAEYPGIDSLQIIRRNRHNIRIAYRPSKASPLYPFESELHSKSFNTRSLDRFDQLALKYKKENKGRHRNDNRGRHNIIPSRGILSLKTGDCQLY